MSKTQETVCAICGAAMHRDVRPLDFSYKGQTITVDQPGWYCEGCTEGVLTPEDMEATQTQLQDFKARVECVLTPEEVRAARKKLKLSQRRAGALLGGGERAFQKYENGSVMVSRAMSNLLRVLTMEPSLLSRLPGAGKATRLNVSRENWTAELRALSCRPANRPEYGHGEWWATELGSEFFVQHVNENGDTDEMAFQNILREIDELRADRDELATGTH